MLDIALLGFGNIGSGVAEVISENRKLIEKRIGQKIRIKYILDLRDFPNSPFGNLIVHDFNIVLNDPDVKVVAEMMGGSHPAYDFTKAALCAGKSVVTSNKECVAKFGVELLKIAEKHGCRYLFEAAVGGGIPIIKPMITDLAPVDVISISGILNGTTNFILTRMAADGADFVTALVESQEKGYAERDPSADVDGIDAARKIVILAALASDIMLDADKIHCEGITDITSYDMSVAESFGYSIKLIARYEKTPDEKILCMVSPRFVPPSNPLGTVADVFNGIMLDTDMLGEVMFYGKGAGKLPTAGAVVADIFDVASGSMTRQLDWRTATDDDIADFGEYACRREFTFKGESNDKPTLEKFFGKLDCFHINDGKISFITASDMSEQDADRAVCSCPLALVNKFRLL